MKTNRPNPFSSHPTVFRSAYAFLRLVKTNPHVSLNQILILIELYVLDALPASFFAQSHKMQAGQVYSELRALLIYELIERHKDKLDGRSVYFYSITESGRAALQDLLSSYNQKD